MDISQPTSFAPGHLTRLASRVCVVAADTVPHRSDPNRAGGDRATFSDPHRYSEGILYVLVNGVVVVEQGQHTGALPGQLL